MKVLLVDDHPMIRKGIKAGLESTFKDAIEISEAGSVPEAISSIDEVTFDVSISTFHSSTCSSSMFMFC